MDPMRSRALVTERRRKEGRTSLTQGVHSSRQKNWYLDTLHTNLKKEERKNKVGEERRDKRACIRSPISGKVFPLDLL